MAGRMPKIVAAATIAVTAGVDILGVPPCAEMNVAYTSPDVQAVNGGYPPSAAECQRLCGSEQYVCDTFTFFADTRACWLMERVDGLTSAAKIGAISGPKDCSLPRSTAAPVKVVWDTPAPTTTTRLQLSAIPMVPATPAVDAPKPQPTSSSILPKWLWAVLALGAAFCLATVCILAFCLGEDKAPKRRTRGISKITAEDERVEKAVLGPGDAHDEAAQPLIPQFLPRPSLSLPTFAQPTFAQPTFAQPTYTAVAPASVQQQMYVVPAQQLVEVRQMPMPYSVMQAPAGSIILDPSQLY